MATLRTPAERIVVACECDHMRPVVKIRDKWHHVNDGVVVLSEECAAGVYTVRASYTGGHPLTDLVV